MNTLEDDDIEVLDFPSRMLALPSRAVAPLAPSDPSCIGYPPTLPIELALRTAPVQEICEAYGISEMEWEVLRHEELFLRDLKAAVELVQKDGMSFKLKAKLQAEELLKTSWRLIHDPGAPPAVRANLISATMRWAGYDQPKALEGAGVGSAFSIVINLSGANRQGETYDTGK